MKTVYFRRYNDLEPTSKMKSKDWKEEFEGRFVETYGRKNRKEWSLAYQPYEGLKELEDFISTLLEEARKEGREEVEKEYREYRLERGELE